MQTSELLGIATIVVIATFTLYSVLIGLLSAYATLVNLTILTVVVVINVRHWMTKTSRKSPAP
jgi:hypothetical protein